MIKMNEIIIYLLLFLIGYIIAGIVDYYIQNKR